MVKSRFLTFVSVAALVLSACGGGEPDSGAQAEGGSESTAEGVHVADSDLGEILVGPEGLSLYVFTADGEGTSACTDACAQAWPPLPADVAIGSDLDQSMFGSITRDDGSEQLTVNGMPLYYYASDTGPGDTAGQGLNDAWYVVDATGSMIKGAAEGTGDSIVDYGY